MSRGLTKAERLKDEIWLYSKRAYKDVELAKRYGVNKSTIGRDRLDLERKYMFRQDERGAWFIVTDDQLSAIRLTLNEALALFLPAQKTVRQTRLFQRYTADALDKLATVLKPPMTEKIVQAADKILSNGENSAQSQGLEKVLEAWVSGFKLEIDYQSPNSKGVTRHKVHPYLIEPSIWSDSIYLIGYSETLRKVQPLKVLRMQRVSILTERFEMPKDFSEEELLKNAWGIWYADKEPETVRLRFKPGVATQRLQESVWHPLERVSPTEDGGVLWEMEVAKWQEMLPWIRGWGADCEVLEPPALRTEMIRETLRQMEIYQIQGNKLDEDDPDYNRKRAKSLFGG